MNVPPEAMNRRVLLIDDSPDIHEDFRKILAGKREASNKLADLRAAFASHGPDAAPASAAATPSIPFELDSAHQGPEGLEKLTASLEEGRPYALAFVDVRMPPGWDGIETIERLWKADPRLHVVICTAYSDHSWEATFARLGQSDRLLILKKPFDPVEISQLAAALTEKWNSERRIGALIEDLRAKEQEARAYASSLETVNRALSTSKAAAEKSSAMKTEFLVHLSAELSNQVNGVLGEVGRLRLPGGGEADGVGEEDLERMDAISHTSRYLLSTLSELSDIARIDAGDLCLDEGDVAPMEPVETVAEELSAAAGGKGLDLRIGHRGTLPERIRTDGCRLRQILWNLVDNAIRFTDEGTVSLMVTAEPSANWDRYVLRFTVEDTGCGISRERLGRLFEPFENHDARVGAGSGLGLPYAKRLARLLGGDLRVESEAGRGSRFELEFECEAHGPGPNGAQAGNGSLRESA